MEHLEHAIRCTKGENEDGRCVECTRLGKKRQRQEADERREARLRGNNVWSSARICLLFGSMIVLTLAVAWAIRP